MRPDLLDQIEIHLSRGLVEDARDANHTEAMARVLLAVAPGTEQPMGEVARRLGRDPTTATRFVDRAVAEGLVRRQAGLTDRRRRLVVLTPEGEVARDALVKRRRRRVEALIQTMLGSTGLGTGQVEWFLGALESALTTQGAGVPAD